MRRGKSWLEEESSASADEEARKLRRELRPARGLGASLLFSSDESSPRLPWRKLAEPSFFLLDEALDSVR